MRSFEDEHKGGDDAEPVLPTLERPDGDTESDAHDDPHEAFRPPHCPASLRIIFGVIVHHFEIQLNLSCERSGDKVDQTLFPHFQREGVPTLRVRLSDWRARTNFLEIL